jgi:hypothetical protein
VKTAAIIDSLELIFKDETTVREGQGYVDSYESQPHAYERNNSYEWVSST